SLVPHLTRVFSEPDARRALDALIDAFAAFWYAERIPLRRARALAALDEEIGESVRARDERRREHLRGIVARLRGASKRRGTNVRAMAAVVDVLHMLTSFETFDALLAGERAPDEATEIVRMLAASALELNLRRGGAR